MKKIKLPRKLKKIYKKGTCESRIEVNKNTITQPIRRYAYWAFIDSLVQKFNETPEQLYGSLGCVTRDAVIWYHWVRFKYLGIPLQLEDDYRKYFEGLKKKHNLVDSK